jgi:hypothetical protein
MDLRYGPAWALSWIAGSARRPRRYRVSARPAHSDTTEAKRRLAGRVAPWGGVNVHIAVEAGSEADVRQEVSRAVEVLVPAGGAILSPVDNGRERKPIFRHNV